MYITEGIKEKILNAAVLAALLFLPAASTFASFGTRVAPSITRQPASQTVTAGQTATFTVAATGTATLTYQWNKNGAAISGATSATYTTPGTASSNNGSLFTVTVTNSVGSVTSSAATLTVNVAPSITTQPASQTVTAGQTATFAVAATGTATLTYQWNKNGAAISGATSATYTTPALPPLPTTARLFSVTVTNSVSSVDQQRRHADRQRWPPIDQHATGQQDRHRGAEQPAFSVAANGTAPLTYHLDQEWRCHQRCNLGHLHHSGLPPLPTTAHSLT